MSQHILVADDNAAIRHTVAFILRNNGYQVSTAHDGQEALTRILESKRINGNHFDLLLTDIQMPMMSGLELIDQLKEHHIGMPVLVISGIENERVVDKLLKSEGRDFLLKPFDFRELMKRVTLLLAGTTSLQFNTSSAYRVLEKSPASFEKGF